MQQSNKKIHSLYHVPVLSEYDFGCIRSPGPGLGNLLFPVSRALIAESELGGQFVYPTFRQMKIGSVIRRERDTRTYGDLFRGRTNSDWRNWYAAKKISHYDESESSQVLSYKRDAAIEYRGLGRYFHDLESKETIIANWLMENANLKGSLQSYDIGIHVRLGDFIAAKSNYHGHSVRQPMEWYRRAFAKAKQIVGKSDPRVYLFTDETPQKITAELNIPGIHVDPSKNAITALINLSRASVVVTSRSTFSTWAVFLGGGGGIWSADFDFSETLQKREGLDYILE